MRKISLILIIIVLFGCSSSDDNNSENQAINPPQWVLGTWLIEEPNPVSGYRITNGNFCLVNFTTQSCFRESISVTKQSGQVTNVTAVITDNSYSIEITLASQIVTYKIKKVSSSQLEWINDPFGNLAETICIKQLSKTI
jgi:hypothetical protein